MTSECSLAGAELPVMNRINDRISYIPPSENPLSADVVVIRGDERIYVFDVGASAQTLKYINSLPDDKVIVISHFHEDHAKWVRFSASAGKGTEDTGKSPFFFPEGPYPSFSRLYVSRFTSKYTGGGDIVTEPVIIKDGAELEIAPIPSTHAKGCLALTFDREIIFTGDATYAAFIDGAPSYNAQFLKEQIGFFERSKASKVYLSHKDRPLTEKETVLEELKAIYKTWDKTGPYIRV